ncbi:30S ribosomal protein S6 alpha [Forsythia ovata]|uniref:30S ribosomal protein S6 alpha n=1 Tax=Forsythia ovata TaxID=205694 RepID=A0ABD1S7L7_9LAMI
MEPSIKYSRFLYRQVPQSHVFVCTPRIYAICNGVSFTISSERALQPQIPCLSEIQVKVIRENRGLNGDFLTLAPPAAAAAAAAASSPLNSKHKHPFAYSGLHGKELSDFEYVRSQESAKDPNKRSMQQPPFTFFPSKYFTRSRGLVVRAEFDISLFQRDISGSDTPPPAIPGSSFPDVEDKEEPQCPPGLRQYETMVVLRPDMSEDERLAFTQKYEELLVAGGGMYVEVFNRGVIPLAYSIRKKNKAGETNTYLDGIYLLFTYFTKPESMEILAETLQADDDVIRSSSFKIRKRKLF